MSNESLTFAAWVQVFDNPNNWRPFVTLEDVDSRPKINFGKARSGYKNSGGIYISVANAETSTTVGRKMASSIDNGSELPKRKWMHVIGIVDYENKLERLYIDSVPQQTAQLVDNFDMSNASSLALNIGGYNGTSYYNAYSSKYIGLIDEVYIFERALSDSEIQKLYEKK